MEDTFDLGRAIGQGLNPSEIGGSSGSLARQIALKQYGAQIQQQKEFLNIITKEGYGVNSDGTMNEEV